MPQFVHLTDERLTRRIRKNGIATHKIRPGERGLYATPVLQNYFRSHQWLRELKRRGIRTFSAVQFHMPDDTPVSIGSFSQEHLKTTAAEAVRIFMEHETGLGLEVIFPHRIPAKAITQIYTPDQVLGWRYFPESHGRKPCGCPYCQRGEIKNRRLREAYEAEEG